MLAYINLLISCIVPLIYTPIMLRMLGQAEYGLYALSNSVVSYLSLLNFGIGSAIVRYISRCRALGNTEDVRRMLAETTAASELSTRKGYPGFAGAVDVGEALDRADRGGVLQPKELLQIAGVLRSIRNVQQYGADEEMPAVLSL